MTGKGTGAGIAGKKKRRPSTAPFWIMIALVFVPTVVGGVYHFLRPAPCDRGLAHVDEHNAILDETWADCGPKEPCDQKFEMVPADGERFVYLPLGEQVLLVRTRTYCCLQRRWCLPTRSFLRAEALDHGVPTLLVDVDYTGGRAEALHSGFEIRAEVETVVDDDRVEVKRALVSLRKVHPPGQPVPGASVRVHHPQGQPSRPTDAGAPTTKKGNSPAHGSTSASR